MASALTPTTGLGSGLNISEIVSVLVSSDTAAKKAQLARQTSNNTAMISGIGSLRSALTTFSSAMTKLNDSTAPSFKAFAATSANENVVKASASGSAVAGTYSVHVTDLATSSRVASKLYDSSADAVAEGDLTINQGGKDYTIKVGAGATLQSVRDQINKELGGKGFSANIISGEEGARLVIGSTTTGLGTDIKVSGVMDIDGTESMNSSTSGAGFVTALAADAELTVDGIKITSSSNEVKDAISGLTLNLTGISGSATNIAVVANNDGLKTSVQAFVDAYNTLQKAITSLTTTSKDSNDNLVLGPLTNDPTTRSLLADIRSVLSEVGSGDQLTSLSQLGINTQKDGTLEFSTTKFTAALNDKKLGPEIQTLFTGTNGIFQRMNKAIDPYNTSDGSLMTRKNSLDKVAKSLSDQQAALDRRTESLTESLTKNTWHWIRR